MEFGTKEVAKMLNVNPESVRRWIRSGRLKANCNRGRDGSSIELHDIVTFVNTPPRAYCEVLEAWLHLNQIEYTKVEGSYDVFNNYCIVLIDNDTSCDHDSETPNMKELIFQEKLHLCILKQELARITAQIAISESQIEYYNILIQKENEE